MASALLIRCMVALWGHSGQGNPPMYGDFEAHRHWMEITTNLPLRDWYRQTAQNDLLYWGLDYPPLMAYLSWIFGKVSEFFVPGMVELEKSRGLENMETKSFMRGTVLVGDCLLVLPVLFYLSSKCLFSSISTSSAAANNSTLRTSWRSPLVPLFVALTPALLLVDHGHFQYNGLCLALSVFAAECIVRDRDLLASFCFCLALNVKQMALYYAPVFFIALLRKCFAKPTMVQAVYHLCRVGGTVVATFAVLWLPFCLSAAQQDEGGSEESTTQLCLTSLGAVLSRQFPFQRGIFEDKVANLWYASSVLVDYRTFLSVPELVRLSLCATLLLLAPVLFFLWRGHPLSRPHANLALMNSALAFFLASFQVHEKSILLALLPGALLVGLDIDLAAWLQMVGCFTLFPLLRRDGLVIPYLALGVLYIVLVEELGRQIDNTRQQKSEVELEEEEKVRPPWTRHIMWSTGLQVLRWLSYAGMIILHALEALLPPPARYPDLYPALFAIFGTAHFLLFYLLGLTWQHSLASVSTKSKSQ